MSGKLAGMVAGDAGSCGGKVFYQHASCQPDSLKHRLGIAITVCFKYFQATACSQLLVLSWEHSVINIKGDLINSALTMIRIRSVAGVSE